MVETSPETMGVVSGGRGDEAPLQELAQELVLELDGSLTELVRREAPDLIPADPELGDRWLVRPARLHWDGINGVQDAHVAYEASGHVVEGAYTYELDPLAFETLAEEYGEQFPTLSRAQFLLSVGADDDAWYESREATLELRSLEYHFNRGRRPSSSRPIEMGHLRHAHYIDNREDETGFWGVDLAELRYANPTGGEEGAAHRARQIEIYDLREELREGFSEGLMVLGDYHLVRRFTRERGGWSSTDPTGQHRGDWSEAYPRAYPELVTHFASEWENNPYIIWALMTVESSFNPDSISRSNARGLLQVIPKTGELISERLGYWDFGPHNLMTPELSIEYGNYYFSELMTKFHGQEMLAFAAYNAGPHNMEEWLDGRGDLPLDAFIETIPFDQAREYCKKVFRYLNLYREIYLGEELLYVGQEIDPIYEDNIHF